MHQKSLTVFGIGTWVMMYRFVLLCPWISKKRNRLKGQWQWYMIMVLLATNRNGIHSFTYVWIEIIIIPPNNWNSQKGQQIIMSTRWFYIFTIWECFIIRYIAESGIDIVVSSWFPGWHQVWPGRIHCERDKSENEIQQYQSLDVFVCII